MQAQLDNGGYGRMLHDLLEFELGDWHPRDTAGVSDDKDPEKQHSAGPEVHWLAGYLNSGVLDCQVNSRGGSVVHASDLYLCARKANRGLIDWSDHKFAAFLKGWGCTPNSVQWLTVAVPTARRHAQFVSGQISLLALL